MYNEAVELYNLLLKTNPKHTKAIINLSLCLHFSGQTELALKTQEDLIKEGHADPKIYVNMGILLKKQKRYQEAMNYFEKCLE